MQNMGVERGRTLLDQLPLAFMSGLFATHHFQRLHSETVSAMLTNSLTQMPRMVFTLGPVDMFEPAPPHTGCNPPLVHHSDTNISVLAPLHDVDHMPRVAAPLAWSGFAVHVANLAR